MCIIIDNNNIETIYYGKTISDIKTNISNLTNTPISCLYLFQINQGGLSLDMVDDDLKVDAHLKFRLCIIKGAKLDSDINVLSNNLQVINETFINNAKLDLEKKRGSFIKMKSIVENPVNQPIQIQISTPINKQSDPSLDNTITLVENNFVYI